MARKPDNSGRARRRSRPAGAPEGRGADEVARRRTPLPIPPAPPLLRDPWAWAPVAAVLLLLAHSWGAPLGEPVSDDFLFLHQALLPGHRSLFDGGGTVIYWRPLSRQIYFALLGPLMVSHPRAVALLHAALLALAGLLIYRALRSRWPGPWAAAAASFPLIAESSRALILWPCLIQDLGALVLSALALHEAARRRLATALAALLGALLCKEIAVVAAVLLPWMPAEGLDRAKRARWTKATAALVGLWGVAYWLVMRHSGVVFQREIDRSDAPFT